MRRTRTRTRTSRIFNVGRVSVLNINKAPALCRSEISSVIPFSNSSSSIFNARWALTCKSLSLYSAVNSPNSFTKRLCGFLGDADSEGLTDMSRHVIGCRLTQYTRVQYA